MTFARMLFRMLSPSGERARVSVMIFHRVLPQRDPLRPAEPTREEFHSRMAWVACNFNVIPLAEAIAGLASGRLPERPLAITFDDGYADNVTVALPVLARLGLPATFFIATGFLDGGRMWNDTVIEALRAAEGESLDLVSLGLGEHPIASVRDRLATIDRLLRRLRYLPLPERDALVERLASLIAKPLPNDLMMSSEQVQALHRAGMTIGAHTVNHPILSSLAEAEARAEIAAGKRRLEELIGAAVELFAYPNGKPSRDYAREHVRIVEELGFKGAVSTAWGVTSVGRDPFQVPRFTPWDRSDWKCGLRLAQNLSRRDYAVA